MNSTVGQKPGILTSDLYFYDVKYRPILSKIDKKKCAEKSCKNSNNNKKNEMGWANPVHYQMGWLLWHSNQPPSPAAERELIHVLHEKKRMELQKEKETGQREVTCGGVEAVLLAA